MIPCLGRLIAIGLVLAGPATAAAPAPTAVPRPMNPEAGVLFSRLTPCLDSLTLTFVAREPGLLPPDTLCADPATGEVTWVSGPVRGLSLDASGAPLAATRLETWRFGNESWRPASRWKEPLRGMLAGAPGSWPPRRGTEADTAGEGSRSLASIQPFPERYVPLSDGTLLFLLDAEYPPNRALRLHDLHARFDNEVEWSVARNLEIRDWVVSGDSLCWALAARAHVPDYGGGIREVVVAGRGDNVQTFRLGTPVSVLWDREDVLWVLNQRGQLSRITPREGAWSVETLGPRGASCDCVPAEEESLWVWTLQESFSEWRNADAQRRRVSETADGRTLGGWVLRERDGVFRPCWGGALSEEALQSTIPEAPLPGAAMARVPARGGDYLGPLSQVRLPGKTGVATLRNSLNRGRVASELWWRFPGNGTSIRLAGPWGVSPSVDTPRTAP